MQRGRERENTNYSFVIHSDERAYVCIIFIINPSIKTIEIIRAYSSQTSNFRLNLILQSYFLKSSALELCVCHR